MSNLENVFLVCNSDIATLIELPTTGPGTRLLRLQRFLNGIFFVGSYQYFCIPVVGTPLVIGTAKTCGKWDDTRLGCRGGRSVQEDIPHPIRKCQVSFALIAPSIPYTIWQFNISRRSTTIQRHNNITQCITNDVYEQVHDEINIQMIIRLKNCPTRPITIYLPTTLHRLYYPDFFENGNGLSSRFQLL